MLKRTVEAAPSFFIFLFPLFNRLYSRFFCVRISRITEE